MGGPKRRKPKQATSQQKKTPPDSKTITKQVYEVEKKKSDRKASAPEEMEYVPKKTEKVASKTDRNGTTVMEMQTSHVNNGAYFICLILMPYSSIKSIAVSVDVNHKKLILNK